MVVVAGLWELAWNTPIKEIDLWQYPLRDFGISHICMTPISGIRSGWVVEYPTLEEIIKTYSTLQPIFVTEGGETALPDFVHPVDALYITGKTNFSPFNSMKTPESMSVYVPTAKNKGMLWGHQAMSIVLYDRMLKSWQ